MPETPKAYLALARRYRPKTFSELIGQDSLVRILQNTLKTQRIHHAYLFSGVRGVGKTTTARLLGAALNCENVNRDSLNPCGTCKSCLSIFTNRHIDVIEFDAASHTGIDSIRELIDAIPYRPAIAKYKVYIIDEVHMLSEKAFNALLKTLEEPPDRVVFIFATTEERSIPPTILSRCLRFDLHLVSREILGAHVNKIARTEGYDIEPDALDHIVSSAEGSVRDALSLLDQAINLAESKTVTGTLARAMLGVSDRGQLYLLMNNILHGKITDSLHQVRTLVNTGSDPSLLIKDLMEIIHEIVEVRLNIKKYPDRTSEKTDETGVSAMASAISVDGALRLWHVLHNGYRQILNTPLPSQSLDLLLVRLAYSAQLPSVEPYVQQLLNNPQTQPLINSTPTASSVAPDQTALSPVSSPASPTDKPLPFATPPQPIPNDPAITTVAPDSTGYPRDTKGIKDIDELGSLLQEPKNTLLKRRLDSYFRIIRCQPGHIVARLTQNAPPNIVHETVAHLEMLTGSRWSISLSEDENAPVTMLEKQNSDRHQKLSSMRKEARVKEIEKKSAFRLMDVE